jgi:uncharacterized protein (TIGR03437 family)
MIRAEWIALAFAVPVAFAQPEVTGVFNEAHRICCDRAVPGSVVLIGGFNLGPEVPVVRNEYPLVTELAGTSVRFRTADTDLQAYVLATGSRWIRILLPSSAPPGDAMVTVTYRGASSRPRAVSIFEQEFAVYDAVYEAPEFSPLQSAVQNIGPSGQVSLNSITNPARPGQLVAIWGTGLGAAPGDERAGPIPSALPEPGLRLFAGDKPARIVYAGRSGCCAGMDQIIFEVPEGIEGCNVPVSVVSESKAFAGNDTIMSIAPGAGACFDSHGLSEQDVRALAAGNLKAVWLTAARDGENVQWGLFFGEATQTGVLPLGACKAEAWGVSPFSFASERSLLDAGPAVTLEMPDGGIELQRRAANDYRGLARGTVQPGLYTLRNAAGGGHVPGFEAAFRLAPLTFMPTIAADAGNIKVSWSGIADERSRVVITGTLSRDGETCGHCAFVCVEHAAKGSFAVPSWVIQRLRAAELPGSRLSVQADLQVVHRFAVPGFAAGEFSTTVTGATTTH